MRHILQTFALVFLFVVITSNFLVPISFVHAEKKPYTLTASLGFGGILLQWDEMAEAKHGYCIYKMDFQKGEYQSFPLTDFPVLQTHHVTTKELNKGSLYCFKVYPVGSDYKEIKEIHTNESCIEYTSCFHTLILQIGSTKAAIDFEEFSLDVAPCIMYDRTFVPFRAILETIRADIEWIAADKKIHILYAPKPDTSIELELQIGNPTAVLNGKPVAIDPSDPNVVPCVQNGRTLIPLRFVGESLQLPIQWWPDTKEIWLCYEEPDEENH
jgi:hypothetical protein